MKKSKLITCLSAAFVSAVALMSCSSLIKSRDGVILTIDGIEYRAEDLFNDQKTPAAAEAKFNAVYKVAIRRYFMDDKPGHADMPEITRNTKIKINEQKATAQSNADKNGTSYAVEWQKILDSNGVENEQGLYDKLEYDLQKEKYENKFYDEHYADLRSKDFPGWDPETKPYKDYKFKNYLDGKQPYHIKHILVKLDAKAGDSATGEISAQQAENLANVIINLANGEDFDKLAHSQLNEDTTARENYGSLGIMSRDTSFVNDFKLGIYMYESFFGSSTQEGSGHLYKDSAKKSLGLLEGTSEIAAKRANDISTLEDPTSLDANNNYHELGQIPYGAALQLLKYANYDFSGSTPESVKAKKHFTDKGVDTSKIAAKFLPRNVIFNKYFNKHNIMVITPRQLHDYTVGDTKDISSVTNGKEITVQETFRGVNDLTLIAAGTGLPGFTRENERKNGDEIEFNFTDERGTTAGVLDDNNVLRDENGRVILVFRSGTGDSSSNDAYQGIHFVVIERSPFIASEEDDGHTGDPTTLDQYYTHFYPTETGGDHPKYNDGKTWRKTFVNYFPNLVEKTDLKNRADTVKDELKKCDSKLNTYIYQLLEKDITWSQKALDLGIKDNIDNWIKITRTTEEIDKKKTWDDTWTDYCYSLDNQTEQREEKPVGSYYRSKLINEACAIAFMDFDDKFVPVGDGKITLNDLFGEGGVFHE